MRKKNNNIGSALQDVAMPEDHKMVIKTLQNKICLRTTVSVQVPISIYTHEKPHYRLANGTALHPWPPKDAV